jgi:hypothetical protein
LVSPISIPQGFRRNLSATVSRVNITVSAVRPLRVGTDEGPEMKGQVELLYYRSNPLTLAPYVVAEIGQDRNSFCKRTHEFTIE